MALRHSCGTCKHDETGWLCTNCVNNDKWERHPDYDYDYRETEEDVGLNNETKPPVISTVQFELMGHSCMSMSHAICEYYVNRNGSKEQALIDLEELSEHIDAFVRAERKQLEYYKSKEE